MASKSARTELYVKLLGCRAVRITKEKRCSILNMEEPVVEIVEDTEPVIGKSKPVIEKPEPVSQTTEATVEKPPKNKGGRPAGSKDKAPRRKKIIEHPIEQELPKPEPEPKTEPRTEPEPIPQPKPEPNQISSEPEPLSPRTLLRESARHMLELKKLNDAARKSHLQNAYSRRLAVF